ncbi:glycosyltransferase [Haliea sp. E17]|uniref:glycosyltransferase n=1 Tax=Haliea sp. E17 TaxID=3401576 RepID=UPI003AAB725A
MEEDSPKVSIYIPTRNRAELARRAVLSVLDQTYQNLEIFVVNDGSTDNTQAVLECLSQSDDRINLLRNETSSGAPACRNRAIRAASGQYITGLDDDDYFTKCRIEDFVKNRHLLSTGIVGLTTSRLQKVSETRFIRIDSGPTITRDMLFIRNFIGSQVFCRKADLLDAGLFDEKMPAWQDLELFLRLLKKGNVASLDNESYIIDTSHESERISTSKAGAIERAYEIILASGELTKTQGLRLKAQLQAYGCLSEGQVFAVICQLAARGDFIAARSNLVRMARRILPA